MQKASRIYVVGHTGLIGSAVVRRLEHAGYGHLTMATHGDLDLTDAIAVDRFFFCKGMPEYVVLAAGRVGGIEENRICLADFMNANLWRSN